MKAVLIEAFSDRACAGNGAAVVLLDAARNGEWLQAVAGSLRQSETAFLLRQDGRWLLRWFTPSCEVPLCGHATLASLLALGPQCRPHPTAGEVDAAPSCSPTRLQSGGQGTAAAV
ncbi:MAG: PhzF family phenazine biosynthesis protein, partial [Cyanobium sp.]